MRRWKVVDLSPEVLTAWMHGHPWSRVTSTLPTDASVVYCHWHEDRVMLRVIMESAEWDEVPEGSVLEPATVIWDIEKADDLERLLYGR